MSTLPFGDGHSKRKIFLLRNTKILPKEILAKAIVGLKVSGPWYVPSVLFKKIFSYGVLFYNWDIFYFSILWSEC